MRPKEQIYSYQIFQLYQRALLLAVLKLFSLSLKMEPSMSGTSMKWLNKKPLFRRDSKNDGENSDIPLPNFSKSDLKMIAMLALIKKFNDSKQKIIAKYEREANEKLTNSGSNSNKNYTNLAIEPIKKQVVELTKVSKIFQQVQFACMAELKSCANNKQGGRRSLVSSSFNLSFLNSENVNPMSKTLKPSKTIQFNEATHGTGKIEESGKIQESQIQNTGCRGEGSNHKKYISQLSFRQYRIREGKTIGRKLNRDNIFFMKRKQQLDFLKKIAIEFSSQQAEFRSLAQCIEIFLKNLNRANYFLKMIDQSQEKCKRVVVYIKELIKIFSLIVNIFKELSRLHPSLTLPIQPINFIKDEQFYGTDRTVYQIEEYYEKANEIIRVIRHFSLSPIFGIVVSPQKNSCCKLVSLLVEARYTLRYLEKEVENLEATRKQPTKLSKWQKAYRSKFIPKTTVL